MLIFLNKKNLLIIKIRDNTVKTIIMEVIITVNDIVIFLCVNLFVKLYIKSKSLFLIDLIIIIIKNEVIKNILEINIALSSSLIFFDLKFLIILKI